MHLDPRQSHKLPKVDSIAITKRKGDTDLDFEAVKKPAGVLFTNIENVAMTMHHFIQPIHFSMKFIF